MRLKYDYLYRVIRKDRRCLDLTQCAHVFGCRKRGFTSACNTSIVSNFFFFCNCNYKLQFNVHIVHSKEKCFRQSGCIITVYIFLFIMEPVDFFYNNNNNKKVYINFAPKMMANAFYTLRRFH